MATYKSDVITLAIGGITAYLNDVPSTLDVAPVAVNGRTIFPVRYIAESFNFDVGWDGTTRTITISSPEPITEADIKEAKAVAEKYAEAVYKLDIAEAFKNVDPNSEMYKNGTVMADIFNAETIAVVMGFEITPTQKQKDEFAAAVKGLLRNAKYEMGEAKTQGSKIIVPCTMYMPDFSQIDFTDEAMMEQAVKRMGYNDMIDFALKLSTASEAEQNSAIFDIMIEIFEIIGETEIDTLAPQQYELTLKKINGVWLVTEDK